MNVTGKQLLLVIALNITYLSACSGPVGTNDPEASVIEGKPLVGTGSADYSSSDPVITVTPRPTEPPLTFTVTPVSTVTDSPIRVEIALAAISEPPLLTTDFETGVLEGFQLDVMNAVALEADLDVHYTLVPYEDMMQGVAQCDYDAAVGGRGRVAEGNSSILVSDAYLNVQQALITLQENQFESNPEGMAGRRIGIFVDFIFPPSIVDVDTVLFEYVSSRQMVDELLAGNLDGTVLPLPIARYHFRQHPEQLKLSKIVSDTWAYVFWVCPTNKSLLDRINTGLQSAFQAHLIEMAQRKWLEGDLPMHIPTESP